MTKKTQAVFNKFIRLRDKMEPCISCGSVTGKRDAGHYRSVGAHPALRFEELNNNSQCVPCNQHKSGNLVDYRLGLIKKIGLSNVEWIEGPHEPKKYTAEDLKRLYEIYSLKCKELE